MSIRRPVAVVALLVVLAGIAPAQPARAALPGPVLVSPLGGTAGSSMLELRWERVDGAVAYHLEVFRGDPDGTPVLDETTVNDRWFGRLDLAGATTRWRVAAIDADGVEGIATSAVFTAANPAPVAVWPPDGATVTHPVETPVLAWRSAYFYDQLYGDQDTVAVDPPTDNIGVLWLGDWRWQAGPMTGPGQPGAARSEVRTFTYAWPDATPTLLDPPADAHVAAGTAFRISWAHLPGASGYEWQVLDAARNVDAGTGTPSIGDGILATWGDVTGTLEPGTYTWRVRGRMAGTERLSAQYGPWSEERPVVVDPRPLPASLEPADGGSLRTWPLLRWVEVPGATGYQVQVNTTASDPSTWANVQAAAFAFGARDISGSVYNASTGTATRWWRVRALTSSHGYTVENPWSAWRSFTVDPHGPALQAPAEATLLGPADCASDACPSIPGLPILRWAEVPGAALYRVFASWTGDPADGFAMKDVAGTAWPWLTGSGPTPGEHLAWAVVGCPDAEDCPTAMPATLRRFAIALPTPVLTAAPDGITVQGPAVALSWDAPDALPADVLAPLMTYTLASTITSPGGEPRTSQPQDRYTSNLATIEGFGDGDTVTWRVRAEAGYAGLQSPWTTARTFVRDEPALQITGPDPEVPQGPTPVLSWAAPDYTVMGYGIQLLRVADEPAMGPNYVRWTTYASGTSVRLPFPLPPGEYRWRLTRGAALYHLPQEGSGPVSEGSFTIAGTTEVGLVAPHAGATVIANAVLLEWTAIPDALESELQVPGYYLVIGTTPDVTWQNAVYSAWSTDTRHAVQAQLPEGQLYWRVCAAIACSATSSLSTGASEIRSLRVTMAPLADTVDPVVTARPILGLKAGAGITATQTRVDATWAAIDAGTGIDHYLAQLSRDGGRYGATREVSAATAAWLVTPGHAYRVRVRAVDGAGNMSAWSESRGFSVAFRQERSSTIRWSGGWRSRSATSWWGGTAHSSDVAGATATTTFTGRGIAWVGAVGPTRGTARVYVDGALVATVPLERTTFAARRIAWTKTWASSGTHTVRIRVTGSPANRVDVDGFVVLR